MDITNWINHICSTHPSATILIASLLIIVVLYGYVKHDELKNTIESEGEEQDGKTNRII